MGVVEERGYVEGREGDGVGDVCEWGWRGDEVGMVGLGAGEV